MSESRRTRAGVALSLLVAAAVIIFLVIPILAVLIESVAIRGEMPVARLRVVTQAALDALPAPQRAAILSRWWSGATMAERIAATAAALRHEGHPPDWDRARPFEEQSRAAARALARLAPETWLRVESDLPLLHAALHKRVALAFMVRDRVTQAEFDQLRSGSEQRTGFDHYLAPWQDAYLRAAFVNSITIASVASVVSVTIAFALAFAVNRGGVAAPGLVRGLVLLPLVAPPVMVAFATVMLFGRRGLVTKTILGDGLGFIDPDVTNIYGLFGVVLAQVLAFVPAAFVVIDNVLARHDGRLEEAAAGQGASRFQIFVHVTLPLALPGLRRAVILAFVLSLTDFANPLVLGRDVPVVAGIIYDEITAFRNTPLASALCVWLVAPCLLLFMLLERTGKRQRYDSGAGAVRPELGMPRSWRAGLTAIAIVICGLIIVLYATVVAGAFTRVWGVDWSFTSGYFTASGVGEAHAGSGYGSSDRGLAVVWQSLQVAAFAAIIGGPLAVLIAYVVERLRPPGGEMLAFMVLLPGVLPGIIFGVGYIVAFNKPLGVAELALTGTSAILILNIVFGNLFVGVLAARAALQRYDVAIEEAAESLGASLVQRLALVVAPLLSRALLLGGLYVFVDGMTTLSSVIFLVSGDHKLAAVAIFNHANGGEFGHAAAKSVALLVFAMAAMAAIRIGERRMGRTA